MKFLYLILLLILVGSLGVWLTTPIDLKADYRTANRESARLSPHPNTTSEAVIQAFSARAFSWRGLFATHTWIATKAKNANHYTVYQVVGWRLFYGMPSLMMEADIPDRYWFNQKPTIILDIRGQRAEALIDKIAHAARSYPFPTRYDFWPGPNSNTFPAYIGRKVPELRLVLPTTAIGKDYLGSHSFFATAPSGTGYQFSLFGIAGILFAKKEGIEINFLGFVLGIKFSPFSLQLPSIGTIPIPPSSTKKTD